MAGTMGAALIGLFPALSAAVGPVPVTYTCTPPAGSPAYNFSVTLTGPTTAAVLNQPVTVTWGIAQTSPSPALTASAAGVPTTATITVEGDLEAIGQPILPSPSATTVSPAATQTPGTSLAPGAPLPIPTLRATLTPTATGTFYVRPGTFSLRVSTGTTGTDTIYDCTVPAAASPASATPPALAIGVGTAGASPSTSASPTVTPTATPTPTLTSPTPRQTRTVYETVTSGPRNQVTRTPGGGAATGGGGGIGPDARLFLAVGSAMVLAAGAGGLMMRRRRPERG
ncbi:hypothetical protein GCM10009677_21200 [Sphaerisporangium rubeum]